MGKLLPRRPVLIALVALTTACTVHQTKVPSLTGPSEFGLSVTVTARPDIITRDGFSESTVVITARDPNGAAMPGVQFRVDMAVAHTLRDFGALSSRSVSTGSDGRATLRYTAPPPPLPGTVAPEDLVTIVAVPVDSNYQTAVAQTADIRLVLPPTDIGGNAPIPQFTYAPTNPSAGTLINFDARSSVAPAGRTITTFAWNWGDGETATGLTEDHDYTNAGTFIVTLTVTDSAGVSASISKSIAVTAF
jgi:PKD domain-containing protein